MSEKQQNTKEYLIKVCEKCFTHNEGAESYDPCGLCGGKLKVIRVKPV
jgi:rRNA maturation endonuclease Nob1